MILLYIFSRWECLQRQHTENHVSSQRGSRGVLLFRRKWSGPWRSAKCKLGNRISTSDNSSTHTNESSTAKWHWSWVPCGSFSSAASELFLLSRALGSFYERPLNVCAISTRAYISISLCLVSQSIQIIWVKDDFLLSNGNKHKISNFITADE